MLTTQTYNYNNILNYILGFFHSISFNIFQKTQNKMIKMVNKEKNILTIFNLDYKD